MSTYPNKKSGVGPKLGPNYENKIEELIEERMIEIHDSCIDSKEKINAFQRNEQALITDLRNRLKQYGAFCAQYRQRQKLTPFNWELETSDRIRNALDEKNSRAYTPGTVSQKLARNRKAQAKNRSDPDDICQITKDQNLDALRRIFKLKPEYRGLNHPLSINQIVREPNPDPVPHSPQAIKILERLEVDTQQNGFIRYPKGHKKCSKS
jgi:hypothetical protein